MIMDSAHTFAPEYVQSAHFLAREAELLDNRRLTDWLALLADDIDYRVPTRITRERNAASSEFSTSSFHMLEDFGSLRTRVARFETGFAVAEDPPTRTRRMVSNLRLDDPASDGTLSVRSNLLLVRVKGDAVPQFLSAERHDVLRFEGAYLKLARRLVLLDHSLLPMENLAIFL